MSIVVKKILILFVILNAIINILLSAAAQTEISINFADLYKAGKYKDSLDLIEKKLTEINSERVSDKRVPVSFISMGKSESEIDLIKLFREKKNNPFFIEDNNELYTLHLYAGRCLMHLKDYSRGLNHMIDSLRYKESQLAGDSVIFSDMSDIFKHLGYNAASAASLEKAYTLNPDEYIYSLKLGMMLFVTDDKKRSIYHLRRYAEMTDQDVDPVIYLKLGSLYEDIGKPLETEKYYQKYLEKKPDDYFILFALGNNAVKKTGNIRLAEESLEKAIPLFPESDIYRRSKSYELKGDIAFKNLDFKEAIPAYLKAINIQKYLQEEIKQTNTDIKSISGDIDRLKSLLLKDEKYNDFQDYELKQNKRGDLQLKLRKLEGEFRILNPGRIRWQIAESYEKSEDFDNALTYYRESIFFEYKSRDSRENIVKIQLKIKRGY